MGDAKLTGIGMTSARTRERLISRLREQGITNPDVLARIRAVPRHVFVDEALASRAYEDTALPIGHGQTISQPFIVARMTEHCSKCFTARSRGGDGVRSGGPGTADRHALQHRAHLGAAAARTPPGYSRSATCTCGMATVSKAGRPTHLSTGCGRPPHSVPRQFRSAGQRQTAHHPGRTGP
jgi:hypothetical protein